MSVLNKTIIRSIFKSFEMGRKAEAAIIAAQDAEIQKAVDTMTLACDTTKAEFLKGNAARNPHRAEIKALFMGLVEADYIGKTTADNYQTSFWIAFEQNVPFQRSLAKTHNAKKTEEKAEESEDGEEGGGVASFEARLKRDITKYIAQIEKGEAFEFPVVEMLKHLKSASALIY